MELSVFCDAVNPRITDLDNRPARCMELVGHVVCHHYYDRVGHTYTWQDSPLDVAQDLNHCPSCGRSITDFDMTGCETGSGQRFCIAHLTPDADAELYAALHEAKALDRG